MHLHQTGVRRQNAHAEAVGAAFRGGDCSLINIIAVSIRSAALIEDSRRRIANVAVIHFTVVGFHSHMLWIDSAPTNSRRDLQRFTDQNALSIFIAYLDIRNFYLWPILAYLRFPLAQLRGGSTAVAGKALVPFRGRDIKLFPIFLHHPLRVEDRSDAANRFAH